MSRLIHLIYTSAAKVEFSKDQLLSLLAKARTKNVSMDVTGMLLHVEGSFLQVIEGSDSDIDALFDTIAADPRHGNITTIIRESIAQRSFTDWSMGFADVTQAELSEAEGFSDFLENPTALKSLPSGRAQKLLKAFKDGRWRSRMPRSSANTASTAQTAGPDAATRGMDIAFQPIVSVSQCAIWSYEALAWDTRMQRELTSADHEMDLLSRFEADAREAALLRSAQGTGINININVRPTSAEDAVATMQAIIDRAQSQNISGREITIELNQDYLGGDTDSVIAIVQDCKENGFKICLDHFGAGRSGLNQMEMSQPNSIALNAKLVRDIDSNGAKQAIVRGLMQTCDDLGIDVIAKHVETVSEYEWLVEEGVDLFQGGLFGNPQLGTMPSEFHLP